MSDSLSPREAAVDRTFRFGVFEVDAQSGELRKRGVRIALQEKPFRLLVRLLEQPGSVVSRDVLRQQLWPADTFVDFEQGLNAAIKRLREALGDSAENPVFIETLPRRGYRFIQALTPEPSRGNDISRTSGRKAVWKWLVPAAAGLVVFGAGALTASLWLARHGATRGPSVSHTLVDVRPATELNAGGSAAPKDVPTPGGSRTALAWTQDGNGLIFVGRDGDVRRLYVRWLLRELALPINGTEGAQIPTTSPDGRSVVFWSKRAIRKVELSGGPVATIVELPPPGLFLPHGISVDASDRVLIATEEDGVIKLAAGGAMKPVTTLRASETEHLLPHWLPGGRAFLYTIRHRHLTWGDEQVVVQDLATGRRTDLLRDAADARYADGRLYFMRRGTLWAAPFDAGAIALKGEAVPVVNNVAQALTGSATLAGSLDVTGAGQFAVSAAGAIAYIESAIVPTPETRLVTVDRHGTVTGVDVPPRAYQFGVRASPDGRLLAVTINTLTEQALWTIDLTANGMLTKITLEGEAFWPEWTRDGRALVFSWLKDGVTELALASLPNKESHTPVIKPLLRTDWYLSSSSISPDGQTLVAVNGRDLDLVQISLTGSGVPAQKAFKTPALEGHAVLSPDGRWLAYGSDETGRGEVYLEPFPRDGSRRLVSNNGGSPVWNPRGGELFFLAPGPKPDVALFMVAAIDATGSASGPRKLFEFDYMRLHLGGDPARLFDPSPDGQRFFTTERIASPVPAPVTQIRLILN